MPRTGGRRTDPSPEKLEKWVPVAPPSPPQGTRTGAGAAAGAGTHAFKGGAPMPAAAGPPAVENGRSTLS